MLNRKVIADLHATSHIQNRCKAFSFARKMEVLRSKKSVAQTKPIEPQNLPIKLPNLVQETPKNVARTDSTLTHASPREWEKSRE